MPINSSIAPFVSQAIDTSTLSDRAYDPSSLLNAARRGIVTPDSEIGPGDEYAIPHQLTFAAVWNWHLKYYYTYYDESEIDSMQNSLAMRRDGFVQELLWHRQLPIVSLPHTLECDDPDDPGQVAVRKEVDRVINDIPYFANMKLQLLEAMFYGKSASQTLWDRKKIAGKEYSTVVGHSPVNGDKLAFGWDRTPAVFIYAGDSKFSDPAVQRNIEYLDRGPAFFLREPWYRDRFVIHEFQPMDMDYLFESQKAAAVHGRGFRDAFYWTWNMRVQVLAWYLNAIERVGANGMLYAYYPTGNVAQRNAVLKALKDFISTNVAAFPRSPGDVNPLIEKIDPSAVGYEVMFQLMTHLEDIMRRGFLGQNLSSQSAATGLGSGVAELQASTKESVILYDASCLSQTLNDQLIQKIIKNNQWEYEGKFYRGDDLPFTIKFKLQTSRQNIKDLIASAQALYAMGVPLDMEDLRDNAGLAAPRSKATTIVQMGGTEGMTPNQANVESDVGGTVTGGNPGNGKQPSSLGDQAPQDQSFKGKPPKALEKFTKEELEYFNASHADAADPGIMIALMVHGDKLMDLAIPDGEEPSSLHVTLVYLGRLSELGVDIVARAREICSLIAQSWHPLGGEIGGIGRFSGSPSSDGLDVFYANVDVPELTEFRTELCEILHISQIPYKKNHGYTPHITLKYLNKSDDLPFQRLDPIPVTFSGISFTMGGETTEFPFTMADKISSS